MKKLLLAALLATSVVQANAANILFDLIGTAGPGLLFGNEPAVASGGTGGEVGAGIFFDNVALTLTVNVGWGSSQGFSDLSSAANNSHIHGPTAANLGNNGTANYTQTAGVLFTLTRSSNATTGGTISQSFTLTSGQQTDLFNGKYYINIHTVNNGGGELRGFLVPAAVPEPSSVALVGLSAAALAAGAWRKKRAKKA